MIISATGPGRKGSFNDGVGRLEFKKAEGWETRLLKIIADEAMYGNLGYWAPLMFASQQQLLKPNEVKLMENIIKRVSKEYTEFLDG